MKWGMVIDLTRCLGCYTCVLACKQEHFLPRGIFWARVLTSLTGEYPTVRKEIMPILCNHCTEPSCVDVCPTGATARREDGLVWVDYDKCVGCRYCAVACPYQARTYLSDEREYFPSKGYTARELLGRQLYPLQTGTMVKCNFCKERIDAGLEKGLSPGVDREATPACVNACLTKARVFGDLDDPGSEISGMVQTQRAFQLHPEYSTEPSVYYLRS